MTAIVGILNRSGAAFAADSASTFSVSNDSKIKVTNHANKIFELSKFHPVGITICGQLSFLGMPWEDIFKLFRKNLAEKSFPHLSDYVDALVDFVRSTILPQFPVEQQIHVNILCSGFKDELLNMARQDAAVQGNHNPSYSDLFPIMSVKLSELIASYSASDARHNKDFKDYSIDDFRKRSKEPIDNALVDLLSDATCPASFREHFFEALYHIIVSGIHVYVPSSELIFWGYGEDELFPSCHSITISAAFDERIKWTDSSHSIVSISSPALILPFAQTDVSNTILQGIDQSLKTMYETKTQDVVNRFKEDLAKKFEEVGAPIELKHALDSFDTAPYIALYQKEMDQFILDKYINKLLETVSLLTKEDLSEMAESLVRMTGLKRHITTDEETVGGPIDVAVSTKGDGFIWIKRKHYFDPDINHHYFER